MKHLFEGNFHEGRGVREVIYSLLLRPNIKIKMRVKKIAYICNINVQNEGEGGGTST